MSPLLLPIVALGIPVVLVPIILGLKQARLERELEHAERMRALELGRTLPRDEPWWSPARVCVAIGAGVPVGSFLFAWLSSGSVGYHEEIWVSAGCVGAVSVISGSLLAARHFTLRARAESERAALVAKPAFDADAYDVVGSRG
jgi:hypothetical protein